MLWTIWNRNLCDNGIDDDEDGWTDLDDPGCNGSQDNNEGPASSNASCNDGEDNDEDGLIDADDPGCEDGNDLDKPMRKPIVSGLDNDSDGWIDEDDPDCVNDVEIDFLTPSATMKKIMMRTVTPTLMTPIVMTPPMTESRVLSKD